MHRPLILRFALALTFAGFVLPPPLEAQGAGDATGEPAAGEDAPDEGGSEPASEGEAETAPVPPSVLELVEAPWPAEVEPGGEPVAVLLEIVIGIDGQVGEAQVLGGPEAFHAAALAAVRASRFAAARVNGEPVEARIRFEYVFRPPPPPEPPPPPATGVLEGRVLAPEADDAILGARVLVASATDPALEREATVGEDGTFTFEDLPPGEYLVTIDALGYAGAEATETVVPGEATSVVYRLRPDAGIEDEGGLSARARVDPPPREVTRRRIRQEELTQIPGTRGDALRAIEILPGVGRPPFGTGQIIIRGSAPNDSEVFIEGIPVPLLYHFGGLTSVYNSRLLTQIDFIPGNFSSRYGRRIGGIIEVETRDPASDGFHGVAEFGVIDTSVLAEFPIGENASMALGFRRSLIDLVFSSIVPDSIGVTQVPVYYDWQTVLSWRPTSKDRIRFQHYGASDAFELFLDDGLGSDPAVSGNLGLTTRFGTFQMGWDRQISDDAELDVDAAYGPQAIDFGLGNALNFELFVNQFYLRSEVRQRVTDWYKLTYGADLLLGPFRVDFTGPPQQQQEGAGEFNPLASADIERATLESLAGRPGVYIENELRPSDDVQLIAGVRFDYDNRTGDYAIDPRLVANWDVAEGLRLKAGAGLYSQPPEFNESVPDGGNPDLDMIHSVHVGGGFEYEILDGFRIGVDGFYKYLWDRVVSTEGGVDPIFTNEGIGRIYGAEISGKLEQGPGRPFFAYLSYTISRSERRDRPGEPWRLFDFDQTHIFTLSGVYNLPKGWSMGATMRVVSGNPTTPVIGGIYDSLNNVYQPVNGRINSIRNPNFHRLDFRIEKKWVFESWRLALFLDIQNIYNRQNQEGLGFNFDYTERTPINGLPIIPALGIRGEI